MLIPLQYDADSIVEPLPESCLECLQSDPLDYVPPLDNPQHIVVLPLLLLAIGWEKCREVCKVQHLCYQQTILFLVFRRTYKTKTFEYDKNSQKHLKRKNVCTSYQGPPTEHPLEIPNTDLLGNPSQHNHSHRPSTSVVEVSQRKYHHI
jgi:hypothetical protein